MSWIDVSEDKASTKVYLNLERADRLEVRGPDGTPALVISRKETFIVSSLSAIRRLQDAVEGKK